MLYCPLTFVHQFSWPKKTEEFLTAGNMEETGVHLLPLCSDSKEQCNGIFLFMISKVKQNVVAFVSG